MINLYRWRLINFDMLLLTIIKQKITLIYLILYKKFSYLPIIIL